MTNAALLERSLQGKEVSPKGFLVQLHLSPESYGERGSPSDLNFLCISPSKLPGSAKG